MAGKVCQTTTIRLDFRVSADRKHAYEKAAQLKGQSMTQWTLSNLDAAAARDIQEAKVWWLPATDFDAFCSALEDPMPNEAVELMNEEPEWAD